MLPYESTKSFFQPLASKSRYYVRHDDMLLCVSIVFTMFLNIAKILIFFNFSKSTVLEYLTF